MNSYKVSVDNANRAFIELNIFQYNQSDIKRIKFKIDTGADKTTISQEDLLSLGYDAPIVQSLAKRNGSGSTADGNIADWFSIDLRLNHIMGQVIPKGLKFPFVCISKKIIPTPKSCHSGCELTGEIRGGFRSLAGNDLLSCFDIFTDRKNKQMTFTRIQDISKRNEQYPECEVLELEVVNNKQLNASFGENMQGEAQLTPSTTLRTNLEIKGLSQFGKNIKE